MILPKAGLGVDKVPPSLKPDCMVCAGTPPKDGLGMDKTSPRLKPDWVVVAESPPTVVLDLVVPIYPEPVWVLMGVICG